MMSALRCYGSRVTDHNKSRNEPFLRTYAGRAREYKTYNYNSYRVLRGLKPRNTTTDASGFHLRASAGCYAPRVQTLKANP